MRAGHGGDPPGDGLSPSISRVAAVINPLSGAGLAGHAALSRTAFLQEALERRAVAGTIEVTTGPGHARELAAAAAETGAELVIVWGGDGTVNEAGSGLVGSRTALALIPAGSGNGLAASLGVPRDPVAALEHMFATPERSIDVGYLADRPFFNIAGIGLDAHIAALFNLRERGRRGRWPYVRIGVHEGWRYRALEYDVDVDGRTRRVSALLIAFANGREYGMGACISPGAELDDGLLEAIIVEDRPALARFVDARHLALRSIGRAARVQMAPVRAATVSTVEAGGMMQYHVDGEPGTAYGTIPVRIEPGALRVRA